MRNQLAAADPEARWASWQCARQAGVLSPNDVRLEKGWPAWSDPTADSIEPPTAGGKPVRDEERQAKAPPNDNAEREIARISEHRHRAIASAGL